MKQMRKLPNYDYFEGYRLTVKGLIEGTYLNPEQMWLDYKPRLPEWSCKNLFIEGVQQAYVDLKKL